MSKVALITGGGGGIGRAVAVALSENGWTCVVAGRTKASLEETVEEFKTPGMAVACDVSNAAEVDDMFAQVVEAYGSVDLVFNNAGVTAGGVPADELPIEAWDNLININVNGAYYVARAAFGQMRKQENGGRIINNGSISADTPRLFSAPYTVSKHAVLGLTKSLALDGRRYNICCGQIDLGNISSSMGDAMAAGVLQADGSKMAEPVIGVKPVTDAILYIAGLPNDVNVLRINVMANGMPFVGRG
jgi:NAD(P)-dependent dehydrogenase (short-subunit alcohol dehydrogenase family)